MNGNDQKKTRFKIEFWLPIVSAFLTILLAIVLAEVQIKLGWLPLVTATLVCVSIFYLAMYFCAKNIHSTSVALLEDLKNFIDRHTAKTCVTWIITSKKMAEFEAAAKPHEVWLVTSDLSEDIPGAIFFDIVHTNLKRGIHYRYFIPQSLQTEAQARQLVENHKGVGKLDVVYLSDEFFFLSQGLDITIYDPFNKSGKRCGFLGLPVHSEERVHAALRTEFVDLVIGRLHKQLAEEHTINKGKRSL